MVWVVKKIMMDITTIPKETLEKDLQDSKKDISVCQLALDNEIDSYSGGSVKERLKTNKHFVEVITNELNRRQIIK
jgi:hypothetical protein